MIFTDTGAWFASVVPDDEDYEKAIRWLKQNRELLLTTDYIVDETLTLLKARGENQKALEIGELFFNGLLAVIHYLNAEEIAEA